MATTGRDEKGRFSKGHVPWHKGRRRSKICERCKESFTPPSTRFNRQRFCSNSCAKQGNPGRVGQRSTPEHVEKIRQALMGRPRFDMRGEKNHRWKGGITDENHRVRGSLQYTEWRRSIFERDDYTCQACGNRGGKLHADHIKPFAVYPELRFDVDNGRTLCVDCHRQTPTYGGRVEAYRL